jgi:hypothetical protein
MDDVLVFTSQKREQIRGELVAAAKADSRIGGAAHLGSAALGQLDRWSDIDLALCLAPDADLNEVLIDWTTRLYRDHAAVANYDVRRGRRKMRPITFLDPSPFAITHLHHSLAQARRVVGL